MKPGTREWLVAQGVIDEQGVNATPRLRHCARCGMLGWAAWEDGRGDVVLVDPVALTPYGELQAAMAGRATYTHWSGGIDLRRPEWIRRIPASLTNCIRPIHICNSPGNQFDHYNSQTPPRKGITNDDEHIPF